MVLSSKLFVTSDVVMVIFKLLQFENFPNTVRIHSLTSTLDFGLEGRSLGRERTISTKALDGEEFRMLGHQMVDFIADYCYDIDTFPVQSQVQVIMCILTAVLAISCMFIQPNES